VIVGNEDAHAVDSRGGRDGRPSALARARRGRFSASRAPDGNAATPQTSDTDYGAAAGIPIRRTTSNRSSRAAATPMLCAQDVAAVATPSRSRNTKSLSREPSMNIPSKSLLVAVAIAASALASGCNSRQSENAADAMENQADAVRESGERQADAMEQQADKLDPKLDGVDSAAEQNMENQAQAVRESAEAQADRLEDKADATRDAGR
jgi:hypothetical protein